MDNKQSPLEEKLFSMNEKGFGVLGAGSFKGLVEDLSIT